MTFDRIKLAVATQFSVMGNAGQLFTTSADKDKLWELYLSSFPAGTNNTFRERAEHDCSCCKQFIRTIGGVVSIREGKIQTVWDGAIDSTTYAPVSKALADYVRSCPITRVFLHYERHVGTDKNFEDLLGDGSDIRTWYHFHVHLPEWAVKSKASIGTAIGEARGTYDVFLRGLSEITDDAVATVLELIAQNSLYRGEEHFRAVKKFQDIQKQFRKSPSPTLFAWSHYAAVDMAVSRIRNTSIGTLLTDLSEGMDLESAVKKFEAMVAPTNYKRPTALVTKAMIDKAKATVESLGLVTALERRYARLTDITVNNTLFADRAAKKQIAGSVFDDLAATNTVINKLDKVEDIPIETFIQDVLPKIDQIEVMFENRHMPNLMSLIAPTDPTAGALFKWGNQFSWSYNGEVADSIKERVKAAGGRIDGDLCCRLAWNNTDDLDFHMQEPGGNTIYFLNRRALSRCGGVLDVDANGADGMRTDPVENIVYADKHKMRHGTYTLIVHQYNRRNMFDGGFEVEVEVDGKIIHMVHEKPIQSGVRVTVAAITWDGVTLDVKSALPSTSASKVVWGLPTQQFHRASVLMMSPNYWDEQTVGNRHWFFMVDGAVNDGNARGFYNEFLKSELDIHRKVLELVGSKTKVASDPQQLSGLGFSSTQRNNLLCRVKGSFTRNINLTF